MEFFSQNFEDVLLKRVFADTEKGFYVDVGCQDETVESVTKYFYSKGWNGINIDPLEEYIKAYRCRVRDINLACAAGSSEGTAELTVVNNSGLSSLDPTRAAHALRRGLELLKPRSVAVRTLNSIFDQYLPSNASIDFLKIDVEGHELDVLQGLDLMRYRPKVILAETTLPDSVIPVESYHEILSYVSMNNYEKVYFDGLNTWWLAKEEEQRKNLFDYPVGIFDGYTPYGTGMVVDDLRRTLSDRDREISMLRDEAMVRAPRCLMPIVRLKRRLQRLK